MTCDCHFHVLHYRKSISSESGDNRRGEAFWSANLNNYQETNRRKTQKCEAIYF